MALAVYVVEADDAESFKLYDQSTWAGFDWTKVSLVNLYVLYDGNTYSIKLYDTGDATNEIGLDGTYANLFGVSPNSYYAVTPDVLLDGITPLNDDYFPDAYYEITLEVTYNAVPLTDTTTQGFLSESYLIASQLPLQINLNDFNYEENRLQFLCIALMNSAKWAGELGRENQFTTITDKLNDFLDAREISAEWSV